MRRLPILLLLLVVPLPAAARVVGWSQRSDVRRVLEERRRPVAECVELYRHDVEPAVVRFSVRLRVRSDGTVANVSFDREGPLSHGSRYCVRRIWSAARFPPPRVETRLPLYYVVRLD
jgi:hypothetical protein